MKKNILVTGGAGYIGSMVVRKLLESGYQVTVIDNLSVGSKGLIPEKVDFFEMDLTDKEGLEKVFASKDFLAVFHMAALIDVAESMRNSEKYFVNNVQNSFILLEMMRKWEVKKLIFSSTAGVYGDPQNQYLKDDKIPESHPLAPVNFYATSKAMMERLMVDYSKYFDLEVTIFRYFNVGGADPEAGLGNLQKNPTAVIPRVLLALLNESIFEVYGSDYQTRDGSAMRDFIHIKDLADAHLLGMERMLSVPDRATKSEIFNLGSESGFTILEMAKMAEEVTGKKLNMKMGPRRGGDIVISIATSKLAQEALSWKPEYNLKTIIEDSWKWYNSDFYKQNCR